MIQGKKAEDMLVIGLYPRVGIAAKRVVRDPVTFTSGTTTTRNEVTRAFGEPAEKELWMGQAPDDLGLKGVVYWWGHVGVAASGEGTITHVLVRERGDDTSGK